MRRCPYNQPRADRCRLRPGSRRWVARSVRALVVLAIAATLAGGPLRASAADKQTEITSGLTAAEQTALLNAYERNDIVAMRAIVIAAIAVSSDKSAEIVRDTFRLVPLQATDIVARAAKTFPQLADRITSVAEELTKPKKTAQSGGEQNQAAAPPPTLVPKTEAPEKPFGEWSGETVIGGNYKNSTQDSMSLHAEFKLTQKIAKWKNTAGVVFDFGRANGETNSQDLKINGRAQRQVSDKLYGFGLASYEDDRFSGFDYQITEGAGVGYQLFDTDRFKFSFEGGPSVRHSLVTTSKELNNELLLRLATELEWNISDTAKFTNETALLLAKNAVELDTNTFGQVNDASETTNTSALDLQIIGNLSARLSYEIHFRSDPPQGGQTTESTARVSLVHHF